MVACLSPVQVCTVFMCIQVCSDMFMCVRVCLCTFTCPVFMQKVFFWYVSTTYWFLMYLFFFHKT